MKQKNESQFKELQLVEIDHKTIAIIPANGNVSVNLTQMGKSFGTSKRPANWLKTKEAKDYISALGDATKRASADLVQLRKGGTSDEQGTWAFDYRLANRYAQWLSPHYSIKVDEMILGMLMNQNKPETKQLDTNASHNEDDVYLCKLDETYTHCVYHKGEIYTKMGRILKYLGYTTGVKNTNLRNKMGLENIITANVGIVPQLFCNRKAIENYLDVARDLPSGIKISIVMRDIFNYEMAGGFNNPYTYHYTDREMLAIHDLLIKKPISREAVLTILSNGKI